ncbi:hypothetical protein RB614_11070 [Phytohabitans sp. ZYX-F-186]|uniref:DUF4234 domain-containing protein n=1 Tax=Phytohabitans maris TaxID=3071409 RepID=A0ABU0ZGJ6_9ACTN|nr:hypothetical protein [Phytohabitans sp. ZYX-F-186]MDQ7905062.1 hypothetical protein [Phytohabitans sp. ZYX-F-186]
MPDAVWPTVHPRPTSSRNGFGRELKGHTRTDRGGGHFATCWVVAFGLPIVPVSRYYLREDRAARRHRIEGESRPRAAEVARTYAFCWLLVPAVVVAPLLVLLSQADRIGDEASTGSKLAFAGVFLAVLGGSIAAVTALLALYRARWAPVREAVWVEAPATER